MLHQDHKVFPCSNALVDKGMATGVMYLDFDQGLNTVSQDFLISKLQTCGFEKLTNQWINNCFPDVSLSLILHKVSFPSVSHSPAL